MARQIQIRRGTAAEHESFTGAVGEVTMDTDAITLRVHDGETPGGVQLARLSDILESTGGGLPGSSSGGGGQVGDFIRTTNTSVQDGRLTCNGAAYPIAPFTGLADWLAADSSRWMTFTDWNNFNNANGYNDLFGYDSVNGLIIVPNKANEWRGELTKEYRASDGSSWYRQYKSGWVEQGGVIKQALATANSATITMPITMADSNYVIVASGVGDNTSGYLTAQLVSRTATSFDLKGGGSTTGTYMGFVWRVVGFAAGNWPQQEVIKVVVYNAAVPATTSQFGDFINGLNSKVDLAPGVLQSDVDYVVASAVAPDNSYWYRKYKSGWVEQGGFYSGGTYNPTITFPVPMANANYFCNVYTFDGTDPISGSASSTSGHISNLRTATSMAVRQRSGAGNSLTSSFFWEVRGRAA